jgi:hypothetical protein
MTPDELASDVQQHGQQTAASAELGTTGPDVVGVRTAIASLELGIDPAMNAGKTLERSARFWAAVEPAKRDLLALVRQDRGGVDDAPQTLLGLQDAYCETRLFRAAMFLRLVDAGGPITTKGKARALYRAYLEALDRETKLAQVLGLERKARKVQTVAEVLA